MKIDFLENPARRSAPVPGIVVTGSDTVVLVGCGPGSAEACRSGILPAGLDAVFFSNAHPRNCGDFYNLLDAISEALPSGRKRLPVWCPDVEMQREIVADVLRLTRLGRLTFDVVVQVAAHRASLLAKNLSVDVVLMAHRIPSAGWRITSAPGHAQEGVVAITGDTAAHPGIVDLARKADVLVHDAPYLEKDLARASREGRSTAFGAGRSAGLAEVQLLVLAGLEEAAAASALAAPLLEARQGFRGEVLPGVGGVSIEWPPAVEKGQEACERVGTSALGAS